MYNSAALALLEITPTFLDAAFQREQKSAENQKKSSKLPKIFKNLNYEGGIREQSNERVWIPYKINCKTPHNTNNTVLEEGNLMSQAIIIC